MHIHILAFSIFCSFGCVRPRRRVSK